jgi:hypothetical protein
MAGLAQAGAATIIGGRRPQRMAWSSGSTTCSWKDFSSWAKPCSQISSG